MKGRLKIKYVAFRVLAIAAFLFLLLLCWSSAYGITLSLFPKWWPQASDFVKGLATALLGFIIFVATMTLISLFFPRRHVELFQMLMEALQKIARGDFSVNLDVKMNHRWGELVEGINHMAGQLNEMEQMRQEFISNVSHEIQSPLTSISGFARALHNENLSSEERMHYLDIIETESKRLSKLSDNLLRLTSLEGKHHPMERKLYSLDRQLRQIILACELQWLEKEIEMEVALPKADIFADEDMLSQVWTNLLHNSIKFTTHGGKIDIQLHQLEQEVSIVIADSGIGIAKEDVERIFERFFKADKARNRTGGGSGLGLSIVKKIVDLHHGSICVQSQLGEGTTIAVTLPVSAESPK